MKAMVLAAGRGERLRPLTDTLPKPLITAGDRTLIEHQLDRLARAGVDEVVINVHHLADRIIEHLGDGDQYGVRIAWSVEDTLLETGGGIRRALPMLGPDPFYVVSADTYIDAEITVLGNELPDGVLGRLLMTANPAHHAGGDFMIDPDGVLRHGGDQLTYTGMSLLSPALVAGESEGAFALRRVLDPAVEGGRLLGVLHEGYWCDVGTQARLDALQQHLSSLAKGQGSQ